MARNDIKKMISRPAAVVLKAHFKPSRSLAIVLAGVHCGAVALVGMVAFPLWLKVVVSAVIVASGALYVAKDALRTLPQSIVGAEIEEEGRCTIETRNGVRKGCRLLGSSFVAPYLTVLNFKPDGEFFVKSMALLPDGIDGEDFRRLRVLLRWKYRAQDSGAGI